MGEPSAIWRSFLPRDVAEELAGDLASDLSAAPLGRARRISAVALFADVSGFTAISEALGQVGRRGTEELTAILNSYFGPMIDLIESYGGIIGKFGGDAMTVLFPYSARTRRVVARRAIQCALDMQAAMGRYAAIETSAGTFGLTMKAGLALGPALTTIVGDPQLRLEYIIAGGLLDRSADAEHHATRGEVVIHQELLRAAGPADVVEPRGDFACVAGLEARPRRLRAPSPHAPEPALVDLFARFLHPSIAERVRAGQSGFLNEHRKVTVLFVSFSGFDYDSDPDVAGRLQEYFSAVIRTVDRYGGYLNKVDMGDKGSKYIVLFGAPLAHENDEERAVRCALELRELAGVTARVGVNTGVVYCGQVGSPARQEYTVMGDPVNLAARLMQAAQPRQVLVGEATRRHTSVVIWEELPPISVKGKRDPVAVAAAQGLHAPALALHEPAYTLPMVGREAELRTAAGLLGRAQRGRGQILGICAEAGMGKSRLLSAVAALARERSFVLYGGACQSYGAHTSYLVWHAVWRGFFGVDPDATPAAAARALERRLRQIDPRLAPRAPLLGPALNLALPDNELTRPLDPQLRVELLKALLLECLRRVATDGRAGQPPAMLIVLEDCHWIDPLSQDLLEYLGRNLSDLAIAVVAVYRPPTQGRGPLHWAARMPFFSELRLSELPDAQAAALARNKFAQLWGLEDAPEGLLTQITARAQGNPFYLEEIVNYLYDRSADIGDPAALGQIDLPDSLQSLILSRIDQLAEDEKITLKVASVIGRVFSAHWLWGSYPEIGEPSDVRRHLQNLSRLDLTPLDKPEPELEYLFKHITTQEVAYESLAYATRTMLHERVGDFIERAYAESLAQYLDVLAHHYGRSNNTEKQRVYFRRAADAARDAYAGQAGLEYYRRLLDLLPEAEQAEVLAEIGEIRQLTGEWGPAEADYRRALELATAAGDQATRARVEVALGSLLASTQSFDGALRWLDAGLELFERLGDRHGVGRALEHAGLIYFEQGDNERALAAAERRLALARAENDRRGLGAALGQLGIVLLRQGDYAAALRQLSESLAIARAEGDQRRAILSGNDMAGVYWQIDDYPQALACLGQALSTAAEIGYVQSVGFIVGNAGLLYQYATDYQRAVFCYTQALSIAAELGDLPAIVPQLANLAAALAAQGSGAAAERLFTQAIVLAQASNIPYSLCEAQYGLAELLAQLGRHGEALGICRAAAVVAAQIDRREYRFQTGVLELRMRAALGELAPAQAVAELERMAGEYTEPDEQAALRYATWQLVPGREDARRLAAEAYRALYADAPNAEYRRRYAELTGEQLPDPPALPDLPDIGLSDDVELEGLLERIDQMAAGLAVHA